MSSFRTDGGGKSFIVTRPGSAFSTLGIIFNIMATVPVSPWTPPIIF